MNSPLAAGPDDVTIEVGSTRFRGWQSVSITRSCESMPNAWAVTASAQFLRGDALAATRPGQKCLIYIGSDLVITGWIDRRTIPIDARSHQVTISGRGITRNLVDCSAVLGSGTGMNAGTISAANTLDVARQLCAPYGITARSAVSDPGVAIPAFQVMLGETPYQIIESVARYAGFLVYEDQTGALVLDRVGTASHASGFALPGNIEAIRAEQSVDQRFSEYLVVWYGVDQLTELGDLLNRRASKLDNTLGEFRLKILVSEQIAPPPDAAAGAVANDVIATQRANWECARRIGRSQAVEVTCDSWCDASGMLWTPNRLAPIDAPAADIANGAQWIIGTVTYRKDLSGTHADLVLMPQHAFDPDPNPLNLFDSELATSPRAAQSPAPVTNSP